jgi:hypothetical protein
VGQRVAVEIAPHRIGKLGKRRNAIQRGADLGRGDPRGEGGHRIIVLQGRTDGIEIGEQPVRLRIDGGG